MRALAEAVSACPSIRVVNNANAVEFATNGKRIVGVYAWPSAAERSEPVLFTARAVILASGGVGALYSVTTNPPEANGAGLGMAARAGALIADPEFVQFHPTAINIGRDPAPLATEALRGEGAVLIDELGRRFMQDAHPAGELAPRDVVARTIFREMTNGHRVFLDCRAAPGERFAAGFPTVYAVCRRAGIDPAKDPIPVAPAAHYHMGGVATDHHGRSSMPGLWSVGECASTGLHGANRLASNSLLEALVLGARAAEAVQAESQDTSSWSTCPLAALEQPGTLSHGFRASMMRWVGLERDAAGLTRMLDMISETESSGAARGVENSLAAAKLIVAGALSRRESVGAHLRSDFPRPSASLQRTFMTLADAENIAVGAGSGDLKLRAAQR
jgi:L-aspartate oxidase